jgi:polysaccharide biosynthesis protein PslH
MKILFVSSWFPWPPDNGAKLRAYHLLKHLAKRHSVTLLSFAEPLEESRASELAGLCASVQTVPGNPFKPSAPLSPVGLFSPVPRSYAQTYSPRMQALVDDAVRDHDAAIGCELGGALYLGRHSSIPRVLEELEAGVIRDQFFAHPVGLAKLRRGLTWWKFSRFLRNLSEQCERTTVVSDVERQYLLAMGCHPSRVCVVPNGVDEAALLTPNRPIVGQLIYPGAVTYHANLEAVQYFVNEILPRIRAVRPDVTLKVTGDTGSVDVSALAGPAVQFTGRVPDIKREVGSSAVCVVPLKSGGGTRLKILEALALGTPVVSTSKGAEGLNVTSGKDILIADSPPAFAANVIRVLDEHGLRVRLAANGRQLISQQYTWKGVGLQLERVLSEAVAAHSEKAALRRSSVVAHRPDPARNA